MYLAVQQLSLSHGRITASWVLREPDCEAFFGTQEREKIHQALGIEVTKDDEDEEEEEDEEDKPEGDQSSNHLMFYQRIDC